MTDKQKQSGEAPNRRSAGRSQRGPDPQPRRGKKSVRAERQGEFGQRANIGDRTPLQGMVTAEPLTGVAPSVVLLLQRPGREPRKHSERSGGLRLHGE